MEKHHGKLGKMNFENLFHGIFKNKTVFVTGHTGFQGSWLVLWLKLLGAKVIGYSIGIPTQPSMFETLELDNDIVHIIGDVRDIEKLKTSINENNPQIVFHLAAQSLVRMSYEMPVDTFHTNIMGTVNLLESIRHVGGVDVCVIMTSDKCYETPKDNHACKEDDKMGGFDPYSSSKGAAELVTTSYRRAFFNNENTKNTNISTTRAGNVIGGGDWAKDRIVPDSIRALVENKKISVRNPQSIRPWQHVLEPLSGILCLASEMYLEPGKYSEAWNFGPDLFSDITVKELVDQIIDEWGRGSIEYSNPMQSVYESKSLRLDSTKASNLLDWHTVYSTKETISETISWYRTFAYDKDNIKEITKSQMENYIKKAKESNLSWAKF